MFSAGVESGGGSKGSHAVGVWIYVGEFEHDHYGGFRYLFGTSVAALNTIAIAHFPPEQFGEGSLFLLDLWLSRVTKTTDVWKWWINLPLIRFLPGLLKDSLGNTAPLERMLREVIKPDLVRASGIECRWPAVSLKTEKTRIFDQHAPDLVKALLASAAFPAMFPLVKIPDNSPRGYDYFSDGGIRNIAPLKEAVDTGADKVLCILSRDPWSEKDHDFPKNALQRSLREVDIMSNEVLRGDIEKCREKNEKSLNGDDRYSLVDIDVIAPSRPLGDSLDFSGDLMRRQIDQGYEDAHAYFRDKKLGLTGG